MCIRDRLKLKRLEKEYGIITLLYSSREEKYNNAVARREFIMEMNI
jgi:uncharacterized protein YeaO (DUF488 family)